MLSNNDNYTDHNHLISNSSRVGLKPFSSQRGSMRPVTRVDSAFTGVNYHASTINVKDAKSTRSTIQSSKPFLEVHRESNGNMKSYVLNSIVGGAAPTN